MIATWKRKEQDHLGVYCEQMGLAWRQANTQFMARQATLKLDKDFKDLDDEGTEDPRQADRVEQRLDIKRTGLQNANDTLVTAMFESFAGAAEFDFIASLPYVVARSLPPHYGAIVDADLEHWHRQPFGIILHELIKARRTTQGPSSQVHALFGMVSTTVSIVEYGETIAPWFHEARQQNHLSAESLLSATEAQAFVSFIRQCAHDSTLPTEHRGIQVTKRYLPTFWLIPKLTLPLSI
jgi:hypothetical protein